MGSSGCAINHITEVHGGALEIMKWIKTCY